MPKSLKELFEVYRPKAKDEQDFVDKHVTIKHPDRNGNGDDVFKGNTKKADRKKERHGYEPGEDEKVYEKYEVDPSLEDEHRKTSVTAARLKASRERYKINVPKKTNEEVELDELSRDTLRRYRMKAKSIGDDEKGDIGYRAKGRELAGRKTYGGRMAGIEKAKVMAKEEVELDEINNPTVKSAPRGYGSPSKKSVSNGGTWASKNKDRGGNYEQPKIYASAMKKEEVELEEGMMKLSKVHIVHHHDHPAAKEFAKNYTAAMKGDHKETGPNEADEKAANKFHERYVGMQTRSGFAGSGTHVYHDRKTGAKWRVDRHPNGKTFYGTDHIISHHVGDIHESVESDYSFTEDEDRVIRSLAGAAEELGEELDLETLAGIAEEVLSELSVDTLKSYRTKARADAYDADDVDDERRYRKRAAGSNLSGKKIIKKGGSLKTEEVEELDELSKKTLGSYGSKALRAGLNAKAKGDAVAAKRFKGANLASAKMYPSQYEKSPLKAKVVAKEEVEDLDEISKATMGRYINKAKDQIDAASWRSGYNAAKPNDPKSGKVIAAKERQLSKRHGGIELAVKKLTKEDIINKAIETYIPEGVELPSLQERLVDKLDEYNLSEAHIHILLSMFDSLNEQNQQRMLDKVNTLEDVNSLLDFAISNRGE